MLWHDMFNGVDPLVKLLVDILDFYCAKFSNRSRM